VKSNPLTNFAPTSFSLLLSLKPTTIHQQITMKFLLLGYCSLALSSVAAFSAVAPKKTDVASSMVDRSMKNVDAGPAFDPTTGAAPAVQRNNNNEVWVSQVRVGKVVALCFSSTKV
jgi:hypothetical protein